MCDYDNYYAQFWNIPLAVDSIVNSGIATLGHWPYHQPLWPHRQYFDYYLS